MRPADTSAEAWKRYHQIVRRMTPEQRMQRAFELSRLVRSFVEAGLRERHPNAGEREIFLRRVRQEWGPRLFRKVYGDAIPE